jgi:hypothetical protein
LPGLPPKSPFHDRTHNELQAGPIVEFVKLLVEEVDEGGVDPHVLFSKLKWLTCCSQPTDISDISSYILRLKLSKEVEAIIKSKKILFDLQNDKFETQ